MHFVEEDIKQPIINKCACKEWLPNNEGFVSRDWIHDDGKMEWHQLIDRGKPECILMDSLVFEDTEGHGSLTVFHKMSLARTDEDRMTGCRPLSDKIPWLKSREC